MLTGKGTTYIVWIVDGRVGESEGRRVVGREIFGEGYIDRNYRWWLVVQHNSSGSWLVKFLEILLVLAFGLLFSH
jgi:hypothetical protein